MDYNNDTLESSINYTHEKDDLFLGIDASVYETLKDDYDDKYEYILPEITLDKNLFNLLSLNGEFENNVAAIGTIQLATLHFFLKSFSDV